MRAEAKRIKVNPYVDEQIWLRFKSTCTLMKEWPSDILEELMEQWLKRNERKARGER